MAETRAYVLRFDHDVALRMAKGEITSQQAMQEMLAEWQRRRGQNPDAPEFQPVYRHNPKRPGGPGTELKKLLAKIGITATPGCSCNRRASTMDSKGVEWCEAHLEEIVGWLREEATKRRLPFVDMAGRILVRRAIANAKRAAAVHTSGSG